MKYILLLIITICVCSKSAQAQSNPAEVAASRLAQRLTDSLQLSASQKASLYTINLAMNSQKQQILQQRPHRDSARVHLITAEQQRDSLYRPVLTPSQYQLYLNKKSHLLGH